MWPSHEPVLLFVENLWIKLVPISGDLFPKRGLRRLAELLLTCAAICV